MKTKKLVSLLAIFAVLMSLFAVMPASAATNCLSDSIGFEGEVYESASSFDGWNISSSDAPKISAEVTTEKAYSGSKSLKVTIVNGASAGYINYNGSTALVAGTEYKITMKVNIPTSIAASEGNGGVQVRVMNASDGNGGVKKDTWFGGATYHYTGDAWQEISGIFVATDTTDFAFRFRDGAVTNGVFYVDDIAVYSTAELKAEEEAEEAERAEKNFSFISEYTKVYDEEVLDTMEGTDFNKYSVDLSVDSVVKYQGAGSLKMQLTADGADYANKITSKAKPNFLNGKQYEASVWAYIPADSAITKVRFMIDLGAAASDIGRYVQRKVNVSAAKGEWIRIAIPFTMTADRTPSSIVLAADGTKDACIYWDNLAIVRKQEQNAVLQLTKLVALDGSGTIDADITKPGAGAFTVKYDFHKAEAKNTGKVLIAAIYKEENGAKRLVEIKTGTVAADATAVTLPMGGVENPDNTYSLKVMYWDSLTGLFGYRTTEFAF